MICGRAATAAAAALQAVFWNTRSIEQLRGWVRLGRMHWWHLSQTAQAKEYDLADKTKLADFLEDVDIRLEAGLRARGGTLSGSCVSPVASWKLDL